jgi:hypothetical protein
MEDGQFERLLAEIAESRRQTEEGFAAARSYTDEGLAGLRQHIDDGLAESRRYTDDGLAGLRQEMRQTAEETRREFHVVAEDLRSTVRQLAEGMAVMDGKNERRFAELSAEVKSESAAIRSLLKLSYTDLDRRVTRIERELHLE